MILPIDDAAGGIDERTCMGDRGQLEAVHTGSESLFEAVLGLEDALATPIGDRPKWRLRVAMAADHAANRLSEHTIESERGFLHGLEHEAPWLARRVNQQTVEHERLQKEVDALRVAIASVDDCPDRATQIRAQALELLTQITKHRQRGADLACEAQAVAVSNGA